MLEDADRIRMVEEGVLELQIDHVHAVRMEIPSHCVSRPLSGRDEALVQVDGVDLWASSGKMAAEERRRATSVEHSVRRS